MRKEDWLYKTQKTVMWGKNCGIQTVVKCCEAWSASLLGRAVSTDRNLYVICTKDTNTHIGCFYKECFFHLFLLCLVFIVFKLVILLKKKLFIQCMNSFCLLKIQLCLKAVVVCRWSSASLDSSVLGTHPPSLLPTAQLDKWVTKFCDVLISCPSQEWSQRQGIGP